MIPVPYPEAFFQGLAVFENKTKNIKINEE